MSPPSPRVSTPLADRRDNEHPIEKSARARRNDIGRRGERESNPKSDQLEATNLSSGPPACRLGMAHAPQLSLFSHGHC